VLIVHGDRDRVAAPARAQALARRLAAVTDVEFLVVRGGRHAMLRHARDFTRPAIRFAVDALLTAPSTVLSG
jgi:pimeloyl-ACP methyl ester carboxylesterase